MNECIICLDEIQENHLLDLSCCSVKIHKICMYNWINSNLCKNKELNKYLNKCIYCKQQSQELNDIIETIKQNNTHIIIDTQELVSDTNTQNEIIMYNNNEKIKKFLIFVFFCTCTVGTTITLIFLLIT